MTAIFGVIGAGVLSTVFPPAHSATALLLLRHDVSRSDPARAMETAVQLAKSRSVAERAIEQGRLGLAVNELLSELRVRSLSDDVLQITASGPTRRTSIRRANALAEALLSVRREVLERHAQVTLAALDERRDEIRAEAAALTARIAEASAGGAPADGSVPGPGITELLSRRAGLNAEEAELRRRVDDVVVGTKLIADNSHVIDPASADDRSPARAIIANVAAGTILGLVLGMAWVVVQELTSDRIRRRGDVMSALDTPTAMAAPCLGRFARFRRRDLRRHLSSPRTFSAVAKHRCISDVVDHVHGLLPPPGSRNGSLAVVSLDSDLPAAVAVAATAVALIDEGKRVLLVDLSRRMTLAALFKIEIERNSSTTRPIAGTESVLWRPAWPLRTATTDQGEFQRRLDQLRDQADVTLALASFDPAVGASNLAWASHAVAVATTGRSSAPALQAASKRLRAAGLPVPSVIVVGASRKDDTVRSAARPSVEREHYRSVG